MQLDFTPKCISISKVSEIEYSIIYNIIYILNLGTAMKSDLYQPLSDSYLF